MSRTTIGFGQGTALSVGAVLGPGVLALPALAAQAAGPASVIAWCFLIALSVPVAFAFAHLGAKYPHGGGISSFVSRAFGPRYSAPVGWWFYFAGVPIGVLAASIVGADYTTHALGLGSVYVPVIAGVLLLASLVSNYTGLRFTGGVQMALIGLLILLIATAIVLAVPHVHADAFTPFLPHGWWSIGVSATVLFYAFAGWEAISHLSGSFSAPRTQLPRVAVITLLVVGVLYTGLAVTVVGALGPEAAHTAVPLTLLFEQGLGPTGRVLTTVAALVLTYGAINSYLASGTALGVALSEHGQLPPVLRPASASEEDRIAALRRSVVGLTLLVALCFAAMLGLGLSLDTLMTATSSCLTAVTIAGLAAAWRLLRPGSLLRRAVTVAGLLLTVMLVFYGVYLVLPVLLGALALLYHGRTRGGPDGPTVEAVSSTSA